MMRLSRCGGTPNIGVYAAVSEGLALVAGNVELEFVRTLEEALEVKTFMTTVSGSYLVGSLVAMNSYGAVISGMTES
jgi:translation initiation factor 6